MQRSWESVDSKRAGCSYRRARQPFHRHSLRAVLQPWLRPPHHRRRRCGQVHERVQEDIGELELRPGVNPGRSSDAPHRLQFSWLFRTQACGRLSARLHSLLNNASLAPQSASHSLSGESPTRKGWRLAYGLKPVPFKPGALSVQARTLPKTHSIIGGRIRAHQTKRCETRNQVLTAVSVSGQAIVSRKALSSRASTSCSRQRSRVSRSPGCRSSMRFSGRCTRIFPWIP
jgi:hypothetical protein